jgi:hypothetical protein
MEVRGLDEVDREQIISHIELVCEVQEDEREECRKSSEKGIFWTQPMRKNLSDNRRNCK